MSKADLEKAMADSIALCTKAFAGREPDQHDGAARAAVATARRSARSSTTPATSTSITATW
jgi:hypothetical protein